MVRLYILKSRPQRNNMSFKSALRGTQINQRYRQNAAELQNIDRGIIDSQNAYAREENLKNNALQAFGSASLLAGSMGANLTDWDKNLQFAKEQGLEPAGGGGIIKSAMNMLNPFKKGGFGQTYSKPGGPTMNIDDIGRTRGFQEWANAYMPGNELSFDDLSQVSLADNPTLGLLGLYNKFQDKPTEVTITGQSNDMFNYPLPKRELSQ